jgi:hypothetical protein
MVCRWFLRFWLGFCWSSMDFRFVSRLLKWLRNEANIFASFLGLVRREVVLLLFNVSLIHVVALCSLFLPLCLHQAIIHPRTLQRRLQPALPCHCDLSHLVTRTTKIAELRLPGIVFIHLLRPDHGCCVATTEQVTCESVGARASLHHLSPFPPRHCLTPGLLLLVAVCCWTCLPRPHRRPRKSTIVRFAPSPWTWTLAPTFLSAR